MEKGQGKGTGTLPTDNVFTRKEYIEREAFIAEHRHWYCDNCERRKGIKNGEMKFVYAIGEVPCRACDIGDMLNSIEDYPAADVVPARHGHWESDEYRKYYRWYCSCCLEYRDEQTPFCPSCGAKMD